MNAVAHAKEIVIDIVVPFSSLVFALLLSGDLVFGTREDLITKSVVHRFAYHWLFIFGFPGFLLFPACAAFKATDPAINASDRAFLIAVVVFCAGVAIGILILKLGQSQRISDWVLLRRIRIDHAIAKDRERKTTYGYSAQERESERDSKL